MPPKLDRCVASLLKRKNFRPGQSPEKRKSSAFAICQASMNRKNCEFIETLLSLPEDITFDLDNDGNIRLFEVEGAEDSTEEITASEDSATYKLHFGESEEDSGKFFSFNEINYEEKKKKKKKKGDGDGGSGCAAEGDDEDKDDDVQAAEEGEEITAVPVEMLREGMFKHWLFGDLDINRKMFMSMIENFLNDVLTREIALDVDHNPGAGAFGWFTSLRLRRRAFKDGKKRNVLIGDIDLTDEGEELIKKKKYKYFSIDYHHNFKDKETEEEYGPTVFGGALTNRPFIPGMKALTMSEDVSVASDAEPGETGSPHSEPTTGQDGDVGDTTGDTREEVASSSDNGNQDQNQHDDKNTDNTTQLAAADKKPRPPESKLPNAAFALIKRDASGKVVKRSLPHHGPSVKSPTENGSVDKGRLRNALARWNQVSGFSAADKKRGLSHLQSHARALLPTHKPKRTAATEGERTMNFDEMIADLADKRDAVVDQESPLIQQYNERIEELTALKEKWEASEKKMRDEMEGNFDTKLSEKLAERDKDLEKLREASAKAAAQLAEMNEKNRQLEVEKLCDELAGQKQVPAVVKAVRDVLLNEIQDTNRTEDDGKAIVRFSEKVDDKEITRRFSLKDAVLHVVNSIPVESKAKLETSFRHNESDEPDSNDEPNKVKLSDGSEVDILDQDAINKRIRRSGHKPREDVN
jgi:hypothetical protein